MAGLADARVYEVSREVPLDELSDFLLSGLDYWRSLAGSRAAPSWDEFELLALPPSMIPFVIVIDVKQPLGQSLYRFWGTGHVEAKGFDLSGRSVASHPHGRSEVVLGEYRQVLERVAPMAFHRDVQLPDLKPVLPQIALRLPLSSDGRRIDHVVSLCDWQSLKKHRRRHGESS